MSNKMVEDSSASDDETQVSSEDLAVSVSESARFHSKPPHISTLQSQMYYKEDREDYSQSANVKGGEPASAGTFPEVYEVESSSNGTTVRGEATPVAPSGNESARIDNLEKMMSQVLITLQAIQRDIANPSVVGEFKTPPASLATRGRSSLKSSSGEAPSVKRRLTESKNLRSQIAANFLSARNESRLPGEIKQVGSVEPPLHFPDEIDEDRQEDEPTLTEDMTIGGPVLVQLQGKNCDMDSLRQWCSIVLYKYQSLSGWGIVPQHDGNLS